MSQKPFTYYCYLKNREISQSSDSLIEEFHAFPRSFSPPLRWSTPL